MKDWTDSLSRKMKAAIIETIHLPTHKRAPSILWGHSKEAIHVKVCGVGGLLKINFPGLL